MSKKTLFLFIVLLIFICILTAKLFQTPGGKIQHVVLGENGFLPNELTIITGDSVIFKTDLKETFWPASDLHPTHGIYPEFDPQEPVEPNSSWEFKFDKKGKWKYHDHLQPYYRGIITVY